MSMKERFELPHYEEKIKFCANGNIFCDNILGNVNWELR